MPTITKENINEFVGKTINKRSGGFHHYPLRIQRIGERYFYVDRYNTAMPFSDKETIFYDDAT